MKKVIMINILIILVLFLSGCPVDVKNTSRNEAKPLSEDEARATVDDFAAHGKWAERGRFSVKRWYGLTQKSSFEYRAAADIVYNGMDMNGAFIFNPDANGDWALSMVAFKCWYKFDKWESAVFHKVIQPKAPEEKQPDKE